MEITIGDKVKCINIEPLKDNDVAPPLVLGHKYEVYNIIKDSAGHPHLDVGLASKYAWIRSYETKEELKNGDTIHWCHPSRFVKE